MFAASCRARISLLAPRHAILPAPVLASRCIATTAPVYARKKPQIPQLSKKKLAAKEKRREQKRMLQLKKKYIDNTLPLEEAIQVLRAVEIVRGDATYELTIKTILGRGAVVPRGRMNLPRAPKKATKSDRILVFAEGRAATAAKAAGADFVGGTELIDDVVSGKIHATLVLATPTLVRAIAPKLGRVLGPKGLMPAERRGTVVDDPATYITNLKGSNQWAGDKRGTIRSAIGRTSFPKEDVIKNIKYFIDTVRKSIKKPDADKGGGGKPSVTIERIILSSQQGPSITLADVA